MWDQIVEHISNATGELFKSNSPRSVGGGCINQGYRLDDGSRRYFVKLNSASLADMFEAEALGVKQMWETRTIRVPKPICWGVAGSSSYIVLEWLEMGGRGNSEAMAEMGRQLARLHQWTPPEDYPGHDQFGWDINNTIGSTPQINTWTADWAEFWRDRRIGYQLKLARRRGGRFDNGERLLEKIPELLAGHRPKPALVHGDLWGGNASVMADGEPVIFDPAAYFGDREVDIGMTEVFGGFPAAFYRGYNEVWPLDGGYERRKTLYNLYHILNHFNLFGGGYGSQADRMIQQLLR
ncbi:fructosamine kinase family protein [Lyngbya sp. CCY1209]|uniref:fructosamine kinase family protein n=1 Tax=Lyngbya sp. CCY1209 TaxID=2886103 RepID=UPI002D20F629|nr:fructosamine kinase family protein [Lyngbya sp. CCY1209]MEB3881909.1 fructosamine kinase family protein [Lyngbya sp. CCY1209]